MDLDQQNPPTEMSSYNHSSNFTRNASNKKPIKKPSGSSFSTHSHHYQNHNHHATNYMQPTQPTGHQTDRQRGLHHAGGRRVLPEGERLVILAGLKSNYNSMMNIYQRLSVSVDSITKINRYI